MNAPGLRVRSSAKRSALRSCARDIACATGSMANDTAPAASRARRAFGTLPPPPPTDPARPARAPSRAHGRREQPERPGVGRLRPKERGKEEDRRQGGAATEERRQAPTTAPPASPATPR